MYFSQDAISSQRDEVMKKMVLSLLVVLCAAIQSPAAYIQWNGGAGTSDWNTPGNWNGGAVPGIAGLDKAGFKSATGPIVTYATPQCNQWTLGGGNGGVVTVGAGAVLSVADYIIMGNTSAENGTLNMVGGSITTGGNLYAGYAGIGIIFMSEGTITVGGRFAIAEKAGTGATSTGSVYLNGGTIEASTFRMANAGVGASALLNITGGTLIIDGNQESLIDGYGGMIQAYGGAGILNIDYDGINPGQTTVTASVPEPASMFLIGLGSLFMARRKK